MQHRLDARAVDDYRRDGYLFPVDVLDSDETADALRRYDQLRFAHGGRLPTRINQKPHLLYPWMHALVTNPRILDVVEDLLGPDLLCWSSQFFAKDANDTSYVSWHQDATYWGLSAPDVVTAWLALTPSTPENGNMRVIPGTHRSGLMAHETSEDEGLALNQGIAGGVDEGAARDVVLEPGQFS
ncbi:MAG: phytanoyl-CoA dioxygenase family protein, partial [Burkholderiaceae bacterium]